MGKFKITHIIPGILAILLFVARYIKFIKVFDFGDLGSTYISFVEKISYCGNQVIGLLDTCKNVGTLNIVWWVVIGILLLIQVFLIYKMFKK